MDCQVDPKARTRTKLLQATSVRACQVPVAASATDGAPASAPSLPPTHAAWARGRASRTRRHATAPPPRRPLPAVRSAADSCPAQVAPIFTVVASTSRKLLAELFDDFREYIKEVCTAACIPQSIHAGCHHPLNDNCNLLSKSLTTQSDSFAWCLFETCTTLTTKSHKFLS